MGRSSEEALEDPSKYGLGPHIPEIGRFSSTRAWLSSSLCTRLKPEVEKVLGSVACEDLASESGPHLPAIRATAWNIERGRYLDGVIRVLSEHPVIRESDILLLTELDEGMARTGNRNVPQEIARRLGLNYVFAPCYLNLSKGCGIEGLVAGENTDALHGNALFSRHPLRWAHSIPLSNGKDKMKGRERRLGCQRAVVAAVDHPLGPVWAMAVHLDAHSSQGHRLCQMKTILDHVAEMEPRLPVVLGGDWNTSTYDSSHAVFSIVGFWRRVLMGVGYCVENHYPHPDRWFERGLFRELEARDYRYRDLNEPGACTLQYDVRNLALNSSLADWIPKWCFRFIEWALRDHGGLCSFKLDWFAGKDIVPSGDSSPKVVGGLGDTYGPLSDHDPIVLDFLPAEDISR